MLANRSYHAEQKGVLALLTHAPFEFHLTGSRLFGYEGSQSDWDFFVDEKTAPGLHLLVWLRNNGFHKESDRDYSGTIGITQIWRHGVDPLHIQIVEDAKMKADVQNALAGSFGRSLGAFSKTQRKLIWNAAFYIFSAGEERTARSIVGFQARA